MPANSMEEYNTLYHKNARVEGYGMETTQVFPCPFCTEPDWLYCKIANVQECMSKGATCRSCGRSAKAIFTKDDQFQVRFEFVQTGGDDPPDWLVPQMRRE